MYSVNPLSIFEQNPRRFFRIYYFFLLSRICIYLVNRVSYNRQTESYCNKTTFFLFSILEGKYNFSVLMRTQTFEGHQSSGSHLIFFPWRNIWHNTCRSFKQPEQFILFSVPCVLTISLPSQIQINVFVIYIIRRHRQERYKIKEVDILTTIIANTKGQHTQSDFGFATGD